MATGPVAREGFGSTLRQDTWWTEIVPVIILLGGFGIYATLRAFEGRFYEWGPYLSPFYSPLIDPDHTWWPLSPALLILVFPLGFRATCYYYRKAYYRAFFLDPPSCAIGEMKRDYCGETKFPFILQNVHRYFFYVAIIFVGFLTRDAIVSYSFADGVHIGIGSLVLTLDVILLGTYTFSCHSWRHLVGGKLDCFSCAAGMRHKAWQRVSFLNERHMLLAWCSLVWVGFTDFYVRLVATGVIRDIRIL